MIRGSDGLDYENLTEKLLGNPARTYRNTSVLAQRANGTPQVLQKIWSVTYDAEYARIAALPIDQGDHLGYADHQACIAADQALIAHHLANRYAAQAGRADRTKPSFNRSG